MRNDYTNISAQRLTTLHPLLVESALKGYQKCLEKRIPIYITWGYRSKEEQDLLYRYSRSIPGQVITTTRGGYSAHNYGLAFDFCLYRDAVLLDWADCEPDRYWRWAWLKVLKIFEKQGWEVGWRWQSFEPGHIQNLMGKTIYDYKHEADEGTNQNRYNRRQDIREQNTDQEFFI